MTSRSSKDHKTPSFSFTFGEPFYILKQMDKLRIVNIITSHSPFELVYGFNPLSPLDLLPLPNVSSMLNCNELSKAHFVKDLHAKTRLIIPNLIKDLEEVGYT
ncbi:hypothetical protein CR513_46509, partial [Mucuna pruriens]